MSALYKQLTGLHNSFRGRTGMLEQMSQESISRNFPRQHTFCNLTAKKVWMYNWQQHCTLQTSLYASRAKINSTSTLISFTLATSRCPQHSHVLGNQRETFGNAADPVLVWKLEISNTRLYCTVWMLRLWNQWGRKPHWLLDQTVSVIKVSYYTCYDFILSVWALLPHHHSCF